MGTVDQCQCLGCSHYREGSTCLAYPDGIPEDLLGNLRRHETVQPDQVGETVRAAIAGEAPSPGGRPPAVVRLTVCTGTTCYVLGGSTLFPLPENLPEALRERVAIAGSPCLGSCRDPRLGRPPFVMVGETLLAEASLPRLAAAIEAALEKEGRNADD